MANVFNSVKGLHPRRNAFSAHTYRNDFTGKLGLNIPVYQQHVTAGTRVKVSAAALVRLQALIAPVMDNIDYYVHFWKIPYRLLEGDRFTKFISGEIDQEEYTGLFCSAAAFQNFLITDINTLLTRFTAANKKAAYEVIIGNGSLLDMCGYDSKLFGSVKISGDNIVVDSAGSSQVLNFRPLIAYYMLHLHWYMNENVPYFNDFVTLVQDLPNTIDINYLTVLLVETFANTHSTSTLLPHGWEKDYFTSALPNVQYGDPVSIGIIGNAPVSLSPINTISSSVDQAIGMKILPLQSTGGTDLGLTSEGKLIFRGDSGLTEANGLIQTQRQKSITFKDEDDVAVTELQADLSEASAITINELRFANALQVFKEREQRFGRRRLEYYKGFFDVTPEDLRLQVPAYLGGGRIPINIADIEQTSSTSGESRPLGSLAGKATAVAGSFAGFTTFCSEESIIIGIAFAMPHITYAQHISKFLLKTNDKYDYFNPSFEHLGEQAIKTIELYSGADDPTEDFGYTPRFNEYRFHANEMHGQFKSSLAYWSLGRIFNSKPALNAEFIYMQPDAFDRIFAVNNQDNMIVSMLFHTRLIQPVSKYGTPRIMV